MGLNMRRGLFRLWVIFAGLFVIVVFVVVGPDIRAEFQHAGNMREAVKAGFRVLMPVDCAVARGKPSTDYETRDGFCWYGMPTLRALYAEYKDLSDAQVEARLYLKAGMPLTPIRPWMKLIRMVAFAIGVPVAVLLLGWSLLWACSGFRERGDHPR